MTTASPPLTMFELQRLSHRHDPAPSKIAAERHVRSGRRDAHKRLVWSLVQQYPDRTACELWELASPEARARLGELQEARRRLTDLANDGQVIKSGERACTVRGSSQSTWRIAQGVRGA